MRMGDRDATVELAHLDLHRGSAVRTADPGASLPQENSHRLGCGQRMTTISPRQQNPVHLVFRADQLRRNENHESRGVLSGRPFGTRAPIG